MFGVHTFGVPYHVVILEFQEPKVPCFGAQTDLPHTELFYNKNMTGNFPNHLIVAGTASASSI